MRRRPLLSLVLTADMASLMPPPISCCAFAYDSDLASINHSLLHVFSSMTFAVKYSGEEALRRPPPLVSTADSAAQT